MADEVTITKVGLKYLRVESRQHSYAVGLVKASLKERDAYHDAGRAFLSRQHFRDHVLAEIAWDKLRSFVVSVYQCPSYLTAGAVNAALDALKEQTHA